MSEEKEESDYSDIIDDEAVRMQMEDLDSTINEHVESWKGKVPERKYEGFDFENSDIMKRWNENQELLRQSCPRLLEQSEPQTEQNLVTVVQPGQNAG